MRAGEPISLAQLEKMGLPRDEGGPTFREPWEAQAFASTVALSEAGHFTWAEWVDAFSAELAAAAQAGNPDTDASAYFQHWLTALEKLVADKNLVPGSEMGARKEEWRQAYLNTPHGKPVELSAAHK